MDAYIKVQKNEQTKLENERKRLQQEIESEKAKKKENDDKIQKVSAEIKQLDDEQNDKLKTERDQLLEAKQKALQFIYVEETH